MDQLLSRFVLKWVIHIEQVAEACVIVVAATHVSLLLGDDFTSILEHKGALLNVLHREETPHDDGTLFEPSNLHLVIFLVIRVHQIIETEVLIAATVRVALAESEHFIDAVCRSHLSSDHAAGLGTDYLLVGGIEQLAIPSVTRALL